MISFNQLSKLGSTSLQAGRLGISPSYGISSKGIEEAFERGCNYLTWGSFIRGRLKHMKEALTNIKKNGKREKLILSMMIYNHIPILTERSLYKGLKAIGLEYADVLILGHYSNRPPHRMVERLIKLKEKGLIRHTGMTSHNRKLIGKLVKENLLDIYHVRYNAAHRGAEKDIFPFIDEAHNPGIISFTATSWKALLNPKKMPENEEPPSAVDCYRFALSNPHVNICMSATRNIEQLRENLQLLEMGPLTEEEMERMQRIGDYVYGKGKR